MQPLKTHLGKLSKASLVVVTEYLNYKIRKGNGIDSGSRSFVGYLTTNFHKMG